MSDPPFSVPPDPNPRGSTAAPATSLPRGGGHGGGVWDPPGTAPRDNLADSWQTVGVETRIPSAQPLSGPDPRPRAAPRSAGLSPEPEATCLGPAGGEWGVPLPSRTAGPSGLALGHLGSVDPQLRPDLSPSPANPRCGAGGGSALDPDLGCQEMRQIHQLRGAFHPSCVPSFIPRPALRHPEGPHWAHICDRGGSSVRFQEPHSRKSTESADPATEPPRNRKRDQRLQAARPACGRGKRLLNPC